MSKGNTRIDHDIMEGLISRGLSGHALAMALDMLRNTVGYVDKSSPTGRKETYAASYADLAQRIKCSPAGARKAVASLLEQGLIIEHAAHRGSLKKVYSMNLEVETWGSPCVPNGTQDTENSYAPNGTPPCPKWDTRKKLLGHKSGAQPVDTTGRKAPLKKLLKKTNKETHTEGACETSFSEEQTKLATDLLVTIRGTFYLNETLDEVARLANGSIRHYVRAYSKHIPAAREAARIELDRMEATNKAAAERGATGTIHPTKTILNRAAKLLRDEGIRPERFDK